MPIIFLSLKLFHKSGGGAERSQHQGKVITTQCYSQCSTHPLCYRTLTFTIRIRPVGVTQKYLVVTCNYAARARGVKKLMGIKEAKATCPELILRSGEDLTPYRGMSKRILSILERYNALQNP